MRCCRLMLTKYQPWDAMVVTRVKPSNVALFHGDAMDVGWWTINWDCFPVSCECAVEINGDQSSKIHEANLINLTNKSLVIGWPEEYEPCPTPFVKLLLNCEEYDVDVIARLDDDFCTDWAWMTWRAPPFDVIVWRMFICLCCEWIPSDVCMFCDKLCGEGGENERRGKKGSCSSRNM